MAYTTTQVYGPLAERLTAAIGIGAADARRVMNDADYNSHTLHVWRDDAGWHVTVAYRHLAEYYEGRKAILKVVERARTWVPLGEVGALIDDWLERGARAELALTITPA
jgi:hypothetical protein